MCLIARLSFNPESIVRTEKRIQSTQTMGRLAGEHETSFCTRDSCFACIDSILMKESTCMWDRMWDNAFQEVNK